jgi:hypothetical protein
MTTIFSREHSMPWRILTASLLVLSWPATLFGDDASRAVAASALDAQKFATPPNEYRPVDCWWWEAGRLTKERLRWQLEEMHAKGVGGTWLYPRFGASQPLSSEPGFWTDGWWDFVRFALDEHQRLGMVQFANDWLGRLDKSYFQSQLRAEAAQKPLLAGRRLVAHFARSTAAETLTLRIPDDQAILAAAAYQLREQLEDAVDDESRIDLAEFVNGQELQWEAPGPEWLLVVVASESHDLNYLEPQVAARWIEIYYEQYRKELGDRLGKSLVAYGPDERSVLGGNILYGENLRALFEENQGYDPLPDLGALFIDIGPRTDSVRCQYYEAMNTLLEENLYAPMADWLHDHNMKHVTIATWGRESLVGQTSNYGDFPRMMKHFDMPGNEDSSQSGPLGAFIDTKMSSSMAHLHGKNRVAVCAYWGMGWGFTQAENIARTNVDYALGVNLYNTHGVLYSLLAGRNEWVPPEVHFYQPYWQTWRTFTDYVSRLSYVLSQGQHRADVALVYPLSTLHAQWHSGSKFEQPAEEAQATTFSLANALYANSLDFDFIDEASLAESGADAGRIKVGGLEFPAVVLPAMSTIRIDALTGLAKFVEAGGTLVVFRQPPTASAEEGRDDPELQHLWQELLGDYENRSESIVEQRNDAGGRTILVRSTDTDAVKAIRTAIEPDVTTAATDLLHTHQQLGEQHIYFFVNRQPQQRTVDVAVSALGRPEIWDARTGDIRPLYRFRPSPKGTELQLDMGPHEGVLVVLHPEAPGPHIVIDNLDSVQAIDVTGNRVDLLGMAGGSEKLHAEVSLDGRTFVGKTEAPAAAEPVQLDGLWECEYCPTMDNKWGDFRYPASNEIIGPEAPRTKYRTEPPTTSARADWEAKDLNDDDWRPVHYTFGPYWRALEPIDERHDSTALRERIFADPNHHAEIVESGAAPLHWQPYSYSWKFGADRADVHQLGNDGLGPVPAEFLVFDAARGGRRQVRYLAARVFSPREQALYLDFGGIEKSPPRLAWLNGELVMDIDDEPLPALRQVTLQSGWNHLVLRLVQSGRRPLATYAVFHSHPTTPAQPRFMPLSRWSESASDLIFDSRAAAQESVGWYRFKAPPGATQAKLALVANSVEAWVDGRPIEIVDGVINLEASPQRPREVKQVALRVRHKPGLYEGAAFQAPIVFACERGQIPLGDWSEYGLQHYSGGVEYRRRFVLTDWQESDSVSLDLGDVRTSAEVKINGRSAGVRLAPPFVFDLSDSVKSGENEIEVKVLNTLANFMSAGPSKYVFKGQTVSGLLGPASVRIQRSVRIHCRPVDEHQQTSDGVSK